MGDRFAVFILTHGRPDNVMTYTALERGGYTGETYIIVDNEDATIDQYRQRYGDKVIVFDKAAVAQTFDEAGLFEDRRAVVYARNACFQIAEDLGIDYFLQLDDDYSGFWYRFDSDGQFVENKCGELDKLFSVILEFYKSIPAETVAVAQSGDFLGGKFGYSASKIWLKRKAMNTFFCSVKRPFTFVGRINEDVNTYVLEGRRGRLFLTAMNVMIHQRTTQRAGGGMTELYQASGTYIKSFYTVMFSPSCVKIVRMGATDLRLHHRIDWRRAVPCILREEYART